jgi:hypothetical protein
MLAARALDLVGHQAGPEPASRVAPWANYLLFHRNVLAHEGHGR